MTTSYYDAAYLMSFHMATAKSNVLSPRKGYKDEWVVDVPWEKRKEIIEWCREHLGEPGRDRKYHWRATWALMNVKHFVYADETPRIFLRREADVTMFMLKWTGNGK